MRFKANGKLLLSGEYFVLDGTKALAVPTKYGQSLEVNDHRGVSGLYWNSYQANGDLWLSVKLDPKKGGELIELVKGDPAAAERLGEIIKAGSELNWKVPKLLDNKTVTTKLTFPNDWGLGSSSTLIWMLAQWWQVDPFLLLSKTFGGSGYDLACAGANGALEFWRDAEKTAHWTPFEVGVDWVDRTFFVHLNRKQNSRDGIKHYRAKPLDESVVAELTQVGRALRQTLLPRPTSPGRAGFCESKKNTEKIYATAQGLLDRHEAIVSQFIELPKVKDLHFADFKGSVKSLGAWGGDFVWVLPDDELETAQQYFRDKGFETILSWKEMVA